MFWHCSDTFGVRTDTLTPWHGSDTKGVRTDTKLTPTSWYWQQRTLLTPCWSVSCWSVSWRWSVSCWSVSWCWSVPWCSLTTRIEISNFILVLTILVPDWPTALYFVTITMRYKFFNEFSATKHPQTKVFDPPRSKFRQSAQATWWGWHHQHHQVACWWWQVYALFVGFFKVWFCSKCWGTIFSGCGWDSCW